MANEIFHCFSDINNEAKMATMPLQHLYAIPVRGVTVRHCGNAIHLQYPAGVQCDVIFRSNNEGDVALPLLHTAKIEYYVAHNAEQPVRIRARARGAGWLGSHAEMHEYFELPVAELTTIVTDASTFRLCQDTLMADHLRWDWRSASPGEVIIYGIRLHEITATEFFSPHVDRYGQPVATSWSGKVGNDAELVADGLTPLPTPLAASRDCFGGWLDGQQFEAGALFRLEAEDSRWWLVTPDGNPFLSFGPACVGTVTATRVSGREEIFADLPPYLGEFRNCWTSEWKDRPADIELFPQYAYACGQDVVNFYRANIIKKYGQPWRERWAEETAARLQSWGMNTLANWSDLEYACGGDIPYLIPADRVCPLDFTGLLADPHDTIFPLRQTPDVFHADFLDRVVSAFTQLTQYVDDKFLLGYFVQNEETWCLWNSPFALPTHWESRRLFFAKLIDKYRTIEQLNIAWGTGFRSFAHLAHYRREVNPPGLSEVGTDDCDSFMRRYTARYFSAIRAALQAADPNHLFWGCRFLALRPHQAILDGCSPYIDILSINWYIWHHQTLADVPSFLTGWYEAVKRPIVISEYSFDLTDARLLGGRWLSPDAAVRAQLSHDFTQACFDLPFVRGCHWFQYIDEMVTGRDLDGERQGFGLVDITDRPHTELVSALREVGRNMYTRHGSDIGCCGQE